MKLKALALALFVAGACASFAVADDGHGKNPIRGAASTTGSTTTSSSTTTSGSTTTSETGKGNKADKKVTICHKAGTGRWVKISVAKSAVKSGLKHGDVLQDASGKCPASTTPTSTTQGTTTAVTTTNAAPTGVAPTKTTP